MTKTYTRRPDDQRQTLLDTMLWMGGHESADQITPMDVEAFVSLKVRQAVEKYGSHRHDCVVLNRFRDNDGSRCDCGYRDIVGGNDGEPGPDGLYDAYCLDTKDGCTNTGRSPEHWFVCADHTERFPEVAAALAKRMTNARV